MLENLHFYFTDNFMYSLEALSAASIFLICKLRVSIHTNNNTVHSGTMPFSFCFICLLGISKAALIHIRERTTWLHHLFV